MLAGIYPCNLAQNVTPLFQGLGFQFPGLCLLTSLDKGKLSNVHITKTVHFYTVLTVSLGHNGHQR